MRCCPLKRDEPSSTLDPCWIRPWICYLSDNADVLYKASGYWNKESERSLLWNDTELAIPWPLDFSVDTLPVISPKDAIAPTLAEALKSGDVFA